MICSRRPDKQFSPRFCGPVAACPRLEKLFEIIFEDAGLLVVNKPAGLVCHPTKNGGMSSLVGRARLHLNFPLSAAGGGGGRGGAASVRPHLVNRLDRETSGVVLIAKNSETAGEIGKIIESRAVEKEYLAIVRGHLREDYGLIDAPLGKDEQSVVAIKDCVRADGAPSQTEFWVKKRFTRPITRKTGEEFSLSAHRMGGEGPGEVGFSLLRIIPRTGRKHQIRIHLAHIGHPVVGDKLYGGDEDMYMALVQNRLTPEQRVKLVFENHALHARSLKFLWRGRPVEFSCAPEPWFTGFLSADCAD